MKIHINKQLRMLLLLVVGIAIVAEIVALTPSQIEGNGGGDAEPVDPAFFVQDQEETLAPGIPSGRIAEYSVESFKYVSVQNGEKQWRIEAELAFLYNPERLVHARRVIAYLYNADGKPTVIAGKEAKYFLNQRDLEIYGDVTTVFPDGFEVHSEYLRYRPVDKHIEIPVRYVAQGRGQGERESDQVFQFTSHGLDYFMGQNQIRLLQNVTVELTKAPSTDFAGVPNQTKIESDYCLILRNENLAQFRMNSRRPMKERFVHITQPNLFTRSRYADLHYGDFSQVLKYLIAFDDVLVKESGKDITSLRYATGGMAEFDTRNDTVRITRFPQAYQDQDTVTGDVILLHRDTDIVEVEHSNAFTQGSTNASTR